MISQSAELRKEIDKYAKEKDIYTYHSSYIVNDFKNFCNTKALMPYTYCFDWMNPKNERLVLLSLQLKGDYFFRLFFHRILIVVYWSPSSLDHRT